MDDLESLIQSVRNAPLVGSPTGFSSTSPSSREPSGVHGREHWELYLVNTEVVLGWPVFESVQISPYQSSPAQTDHHSQGLPIPVDLDLQQSGGYFVERFFEDIHIFNPVLEEQDVADYLRDIQLNGIGWDAESCLMVTIQLWTIHTCLPLIPS